MILSKSTTVMMFSFLILTLLCLIGVVIYDYNMGGFKDNKDVFIGIIVTASCIICFSVFIIIKALRKN